MAKIAVDVVLLPSQDMMDKVIEVNRELPKQCSDNIRLSKKDCLPHISLAMGCTEETDIANIEKALQAIAMNHNPGLLTVTAVRIEANSSGREVSVFEVHRTEQLQALHETVMKELAPYFSHDVTADMVLPEQRADESTLCWISDFPKKSSFQNFLPHITIGYGRAAGIPSPAEFRATHLALCHLGNHCTCRKVLLSVEFAA